MLLNACLHVLKVFRNCWTVKGMVSPADTALTGLYVVYTMPELGHTYKSLARMGGSEMCFVRIVMLMYNSRARVL